MATLCARAPSVSPLCNRSNLQLSCQRPAFASRGCVRVVANANVKPPAGVTLPPKQPEVPPPTNGFVDYAEKINGRFAMIGFFALLLVEGVTGKGLLELIGLQVGKGLGFEL